MKIEQDLIEVEKEKRSSSARKRKALTWYSALHWAGGLFRVLVFVIIWYFGICKMEGGDVSYQGFIGNHVDKEATKEPAAFSVGESCLEGSWANNSMHTKIIIIIIDVTILWNLYSNWVSHIIQIFFFFNFS